MLQVKLGEKEMLLVLRRQKNITQQEIADYVGVKQSIVSRFETNILSLTDERYKAYKRFIVNYDDLKVKDIEGQKEVKTTQ